MAMVTPMMLIRTCSVRQQIPLSRHFYYSQQRRFLSQQQQQQQHINGDEDSPYSWIPSVLTRLATALGIIHIISEYGFQLVLCEGPSMMPTIQPRGEIILVDKCTPRLWRNTTPYDGMIRARQARQKQMEFEASNSSAATSIDEPVQWYQIMIPVDAIPKEDRWKQTWNQLTSSIQVGDVVVVQHPDKAGTVCKRVLGLAGDVLVSPPRSIIQQQQRNRNSKNLLLIPDGHFWLEGDNPRNSSDSRDYGPLPMALLVGRVICRVWPIRGENSMWITRGAAPTNPLPSGNHHTILPAGYEGESLKKVTGSHRWL